MRGERGLDEGVDDVALHLSRAVCHSNNSENRQEHRHLPLVALGVRLDVWDAWACVAAHTKPVLSLTGGVELDGPVSCALDQQIRCMPGTSREQEGRMDGKYVVKVPI
jgi:hypothetical protein